MAHLNKARKAAKKTAEAKTKSNSEPKKAQNPGDQKELPKDDQFLDGLLQFTNKTWLQIRRLAKFVMSELGGNEFLEILASWCARNPHIAICLLAGGLVFLLPFLIIFGFGIATMLMTFTGLLVLEGTLLTIVSMVFFACLGGFVIMVPIFGVAVVAAYFGFAQVYGLYDGMERQKSALIKFVRDQRKACESPSSSMTISEEPNSAS
ncbi:uncharacterized protein LOC108097240 [Drosophila ficusphila]|uniref:uncharacterized protein LOC108097240 n=1 Tax=Drosophila ficusphila TaxID=30025 RepID=UPI0007E6740B|nr:uncharacterized protein LOC108097240 [Drosophila ficusphila]